MNINIQQCVDFTVSVLKQANIYDVLIQDKGAFIGGSLPTLSVAKSLNNELNLSCNDIDVYTTNYVKTLHLLSKCVGNKITGDIVRTGVNLTFTVSESIIPVQIITSEFDDFEKDVLGNYDCNLVAVGFHPYSNTLIIHENFIKGYTNKEFTCFYELSNKKRVEKLECRANDWFNSKLKTVHLTTDGDFRPYYKKSYIVNSLQDVISPPSYNQLYYNKYKCIRCSTYTDYLLCKLCTNKVGPELIKCNSIKNKKITVLGGLNGLGKIISETATYYGNDVTTTSRSPKGDKCVQYELGKPMSDILINSLMESEIIILNAYQTLENDQNVWTTVLETFDEQLAIDRFNINTIGYVRFLQEFVKARKEYVKREGLTHNINMVVMDANESRFEGKLKDGKHLELNLAKTATKQIFYTNANLLASLGVMTVCYDPGWLSYHGISVDQIASKSEFLIPPYISALSLFHKLSRVDFDKNVDKKKVIFDHNVYQVINKIK